MTRYTRDQLLNSVRRNLAGEMGFYGVVDRWLWEAIFRHILQPSTVLLVGSAEQGYGPWYEGMLLALGFPNVSVTDYNACSYQEHGRVAFLPYPASGTFDAIVSISSIEHSGLGWFGEAVDPDADLKEMQHLRDCLSETGKMFLSVPLGRDAIFDDRHRVYGRERLYRLLAGYSLIGSIGFDPLMLDRPAAFEWHLDAGHRSPMPETTAVLVLRKA